MGSGGRMESSSFFRLTLRRCGALVLVGLVVAGLAAAVALRSATKYQGTAVMFVAQVMAPNTPQYVLQPVSDNVQNMVFVGSVVDAAARASGQSPDQISSNLQAGPAGTNDVQITYTSTDEAAVPVVLKAVAKAAFRELGETQLKSAQAALPQAQIAANNAGTALSGYEQANGTAASVEHLALQGEQQRALQALTDTNTAIADAQAVITRSSLSSVVSASGASKQSRLGDVARAAATAGVASVALLLLAMFVADWRGSREDELVREAKVRSARQGPDGQPTDAPAANRGRSRAGVKAR
jgi:hypothetical protein